MSKPEWATDANLSDPGEDWDGTPTRVEPSSGEKAAGFRPNEAVSAQVLNYLIGNLSDWVTKETNFGDASDGDATLDGATNYNSFSSRSGSVYTLTRDALLDDLTINTGVELKTAGFRVFVKGTLTIEGTGKITANGAAGSGATGAASSAVGTVSGGGFGGSGDVNSIPATNAGEILTNSLGGAGGAGGAGSTGAGGNAGTVTAPSAGKGTSRLYSPTTFGHLVGIVTATGTVTPIRGGGGGGGGSGDGVSAGTAGGGGGGVLCVAARVLALAAASSFEAKGGAGVASPGANRGAGGGGGGGVLIVVYKEKNAVTFSAATNCPGGAAGSGAGALGGTAGSNGSVVEIAL